MTAPGAAGRCPPTTWLGPLLLLVCLLVSRSTAEEVSENCSHMIGDGHLKVLQQLIDSQMETSCQIAFEFVDQEQLTDPVCYLKKAFLQVQDILDETMRFRDNTPNANVIVQLQELSLRLNSCFTKDYEEQDKACVRTFYETPLQLLEKIKNVFNETKNLLKKDWNIFSKNCNNSFAKCSSQGWLNVWGVPWREQRLRRGVRPLLREPCCESPGCPGSRSPQDALSVPSRDKAGFEV
uniref:Macrophage colony-stimulating factor 1 n=1 Tax=Sus scrofa TaxID=9823 RepID=A0A4X1TCN4_PIG